MSERNLEVHSFKDRNRISDAREDLLEDLEDAIDRASDQDQMTWLTGHGKRIAAIVPVSDAEFAQQFYAEAGKLHRKHDVYGGPHDQEPSL